MEIFRRKLCKCLLKFIKRVCCEDIFKNDCLDKIFIRRVIENDFFKKKKEGDK